MIVRYRTNVYYICDAPVAGSVEFDHSTNVQAIRDTMCQNNKTDID